MRRNCYWIAAFVIAACTSVGTQTAQMGRNECPACRGTGLCAECSECPKCATGDGTAPCPVCGQMGIPFECDACNSTCACPACGGTGKSR